jgi:hypothetical protein
MCSDYTGNCNCVVDICFENIVTTQELALLEPFVFEYVNIPIEPSTDLIIDALNTIYTVTSSNIYYCVSTALLPGLQSSNIRLFKIKFVAHIVPSSDIEIGNPNLYYNFKIWDSVNNQNIYENTIPFVNTTDQIMILQDIENLPSDHTLIEFQCEKGPLGTEVQIKYVQLYFTYS